MTSHNPGRSQLVAVPSSKILERASASERVFWSSISDAVQSNTEDRTEIRTFIRNIRESFSKITEDGHPAEEVQRAHDIVVEDLRSTIVKLLSSGYKSSSVVPTPRSSSIHELTTNQKQHRSRQSHMSEAVLQGARDIIGLRRVQLERELHELSARQAQLLHRQERGYRGASGRSGSIVVPGFPGPKVHQEYPGAKSADGTPGIDGDQLLQGPDRVPGNLVPTGDDSLQGVRSDVEPKGFPETSGRDGRNGIPEEQGDTSPQRFPDGEGCRGLDGADKVPDTGFSKRHVPPGFDGRPRDTGFSKSDGPPGFNGRQSDTKFSKSDGPPGFNGRQSDAKFSKGDGPPGFNGQQGDTGFSRSDGSPVFGGLQRDPGLLGIPGSQGCTRVQGRSDFQGDTGEQEFPGPDAATGETGRSGVPVVRESDGENGRSGRTGETGERECQGPACEQGFRVNHGDVGSDGAPGIPGRRGLSGDTCHTDSPGLIGLGEDLGSTVFLGPNGLDGGIGCQGSPDASGVTGTKGRQEPECPTGRIRLPDTVRDEGKPVLCGAPEGSGLVGPYGLNGWADGHRRKGPIRAQWFPGQRGVCGITSCVGLRGMAGRQCDTGASDLLGANGLRSLIGLPELTGYVYALKRWRQVQFDPGIFRSRWRSDYLLTLEPQWQLKY